MEDKCSGVIPFFDRPGGKEIKKLIDNGVIFSVTVISIDRMGRDMRDISNTIHFFTQRKIAIHFISPGLSTLDVDGKENHISKMILSILGIIGEMERTQIRERQLEGIRIAKLKGVYKGRVEGSKEDNLKYLSKEKNKKALEYLKTTNLTCAEISTLSKVHMNTITKIKKLGLPDRSRINTTQSSK